MNTNGGTMSKEIIEAAKVLCQELRKNQTKSEMLLWDAVRNRQFHGIKFFRQHAIFVKYMNKESFYIADFYSRERHLVVEIDGKSHEYQKDYDELRTEIINSFGIKVVRFKNEEIERDLPKVLERLENIVNI